MLPLVAFAITVACSSAKPQCPIVQPVTPGAPFLWQAHRGGDVVWLYGTIHDAGLDAVPQAARAVFEKAPRLITELGDSSVDPDVFRTYARIASGKGIDQLLPADDWWDLRDALLGKIEEDDLRRAKPWYAMSLLTTYLGPAPGPSMDVQLAERARALDKPVDFLETWEEQLAALDAAVDIDDLQEAIHARNTMRCDLVRMTNAYNAGDVAVMEALLVVPKTAETMLTARNQKWLPQIEKQFAQGGAFVAVGLGHLLGNNGLVAMLRRAGYTVERMR